MIANQHRLRVGETGIVGRVAATGEPRISLDTGTDAVHFNNPLLPETRSEMALPLKVENRMIGVLDVQSQQQQAFDENDVAIMQILADQLATAIERTRLLQQVEQNLSDLEQAYGQFTRESWKTIGEAGLLSKAGYRFDNVRIQPISEVSALGDKALQNGRMFVESAQNGSAANNQVAIPIRLRGQTIGVVTANLKDGYSPLVVSTLELAIERLALSLESARLYEEARLRADRERTIAQVTSNISAATEYDAILRTTVEEVGKSLSDTEVSIQILSDSDEASS
jgi:GAF domain-containing protein